MDYTSGYRNMGEHDRQSIVGDGGKACMAALQAPDRV